MKASYWYRSGAGVDPAALDLLEAIRRHREAETAMRSRTRREARMGESDFRALRWIVRRERSGVPPSSAELARELGVSSAAAAKLVARLEAAGHLDRERHPGDRRVALLRARPEAHERLREVLAPLHERMLRLAESLEPGERRTVVDFLDRLTVVMGESEPAGTPRRPE